MKQPSTLMIAALSKLRGWNQNYRGETTKEGITWVNLGPAGSVAASLGESFSWTTDSDGDAVELLGVNDEGLPIYSGKLNDEQQARWKRITG